MHTAVMEKVAIEYLNVRPDGVYVDATAGSGGHSKEILNKLSKYGKLIVVDRDEEALKRCRKNLLQRDVKVDYIRENFENLEIILSGLMIERVDGMLFDLGISKEQIEDEKRGFSFIREGYLDMRLDQRQEKDAFFVVNNYPKEKLCALLWKYGEERWAKKIVHNIVREREKEPIRGTLRLSEIVARSIPRKTWGRIHPATRTFQSLRMEVNDELMSLTKGINSAVNLLKKGGRMVVISFHSGEDRIVKNIFKKKEEEGRLRILNRKVIKPTEDEIRQNSSARSAKLRAAEKIMD